VSAGVIVVGTMWPYDYMARSIPPRPDGPGEHAADRELLSLAHVISVPDFFSADECRRAMNLIGDRGSRSRYPLLLHNCPRS
jgi:hypothetical protein